MTDSVIDLNKLNKYKPSTQFIRSNFKRKYRLKQQQKPPTQTEMTHFDRNNLKNYRILKNIMNLSSFFINNNNNNENNLKNNQLHQNMKIFNKNKDNNYLNNNKDSSMEHYSV